MSPSSFAFFDAPAARPYSRWARALWPIPINESAFPVDDVCAHDFALLAQDEEVSVHWTPSTVVIARVRHPVHDTWYGHAACARFLAVHEFGAIPFSYSSEGEQWARGWTGPEALALRAAAAL